MNNNHQYLKYISLVLFLIIGWTTYAQEPGVGTDDESPFMLGIQPPASPEAAGVVKYGNTPVSLYTGSPNISIPIHTIQGRDIQFPISMTYDASGVKVYNVASWAGLGWNINIGSVTRQAIGQPDDYLEATSGYELFYSNSIDFTSPSNSKTLSEAFQE